MRLGDTLQNNPPVRVTMGCHNNENKLFFTQKANGIFGLAGAGGDDLRTKPTILHELLRYVCCPPSCTNCSATFACLCSCHLVKLGNQGGI